MLSRIILACLALSAKSVPFTPNGSVADEWGAEMTFYGTGGNDSPPPSHETPGACYSIIPSNPNSFVALNANSYGNGQQCGKCAKISYQGSIAIGPIVDEMPDRGSGLDISLSLFGQLVGGEDKARQLGVIYADYTIIDCPDGYGPQSNW